MSRINEGYIQKFGSRVFRLYRRGRTLVGLRASRFTNSTAYWDDRYVGGGDSGSGSGGRLAEFKAEVLNAFVQNHQVTSVIEFGCGDGRQLQLAQYPEYLGIDVSPAAVGLCRTKFAGDRSKSFILASDYQGQRADLAISLDVVYHLVEDDVFDEYMRNLFNSGERFVVVYSSNCETATDTKHVRHRRFTNWVEDSQPDFALIERLENNYPFDPKDPDGTSFADFFIFKRTGDTFTAIDRP